MRSSGEKRMKRGDVRQRHEVSQYLNFDDYTYHVDYHLSLGQERQNENKFAAAIEEYEYTQSLIDINNADEHWSPQQKLAMLRQWAGAQEKIAECHTAAGSDKAKKSYELLLRRLKEDVEKPYPLTALQNKEKELIKPLLECYQQLAKTHIKLADMDGDDKTAMSHVEQLRIIVPAVKRVATVYGIEFDEQYKKEQRELRSSTEAVLQKVATPPTAAKNNTDIPKLSSPEPAPPTPPSVASPMEEEYLRRTPKPQPPTTSLPVGHPLFGKQVAYKSSAVNVPKAESMALPPSVESPEAIVAVKAPVAPKTLPLKKRYHYEETSLSPSLLRDQPSKKAVASADSVTLPAASHVAALPSFRRKSFEELARPDHAKKARTTDERSPAAVSSAPGR